MFVHRGRRKPPSSRRIKLIPSQTDEIRTHLNQKMKKGDTWYLVDVGWMKTWKEYTGYDQQDSSPVGVASSSPGPVETSNLFADEADNTLKEHMMEGFDYSLVPEEAWEKLVEWYGLASGSRPIARKVVEYGLYMKHLKVEVYLLNFKLAVHPKLSECIIKQFSRGDSVGDLEAELRRVYAIPAGTPCRVWQRYMSYTYELLSDPSQTLQDAALYDMQIIVIEKQNPDGTWSSKLMQSETTVVSRSKHRKPLQGATTHVKSPKQEHTCIKQELSKEEPSYHGNGNSESQKEPEDDWLFKEQQSQHDELVQSVAAEQKRANQASKRAQDALNRLTQRESVLQSLNKKLEENVSHLQGLESSLYKEQEKRSKAEARAFEAEQNVAQLHAEIQHFTESLQDVTQTACRAEESCKHQDAQIQQLTESLKAVQQQLQETTDGLQDSVQQANQRADEQQERATTAEIHLQQAYERVDEQQERATSAETRLQHSDQVFQDIFQRLIGQLPQSQPHWAVQRDEIELSDEELGHGAWATVKVATFRGNRVAAKCLHRQIVSAHNVRLFTREMNMAANARHPNLLQFIGATLDDQEPIIVTELMPTSLRRVMESGTQLTHPQVISVSHQVALALNYLHLTQPSAIIHRDVSSSNVLLEPLQSSWKAKLSDYGSANFVRHTTTAGPGNPTYAAPEANNPERQSAKMDVFSFGVLLVEMCSGELAPSEHRDHLIPDIQWPAMVALVQQCLRHEPQRRPDMTTAIVLLDQM